MRTITIISLLLTSLSLALAQENAPASEKSHYLFLSGKVSVDVKGEMVPITSFDGKRYQAGGKNIKPSPKLGAGLKPILAVSTMFAEVSEFSFNLHSLESEIRALHSMNEVGAEDLQNQMGLDFEHAALASDKLSATAAGDSARLSEIQNQQRDLWNNEDTQEDLSYNQNIDQIDNLNGLGFMDMIKGQCTFISTKNIENAYGALSISLQVAQKDGSLKKAALIRTFPVGDLQEEKTHPVEFECQFPELKVAGAKVDLFLFDSKGKHVATNMARGLKKVSKEELEELRAQSRSKQGKES